MRERERVAEKRKVFAKKREEKRLQGWAAGREKDARVQMSRFK